MAILDFPQIDDWSTKNFLDVNAEKIRQSGFIDSTTKVGLMSWALWDTRDAAQSPTTPA